MQATKVTITIDCTNFMAHDYPEIKSGMYVECYNGSKGFIKNVILKNYFTIDDKELLHKMDIKTLSYEQSI